MVGTRVGGSDEQEPGAEKAAERAGGQACPCAISLSRELPSQRTPGAGGPPSWPLVARFPAPLIWPRWGLGCPSRAPGLGDAVTPRPSCRRVMVEGHYGTSRCSSPALLRAARWGVSLLAEALALPQPLPAETGSRQGTVPACLLGSAEPSSPGSSVNPLLTRPAVWTRRPPPPGTALLLPTAALREHLPRACVLQGCCPLHPGFDPLRRLRPCPAQRRSPRGGAEASCPG